MDDRLELARLFVASAGWAGAGIAPLAGDASARRYFRLERGADRAILMDAPLGEGQDVGRFLLVGDLLRHSGLSAPEVFASDPAQGFLLLEDLGDGLFASLIGKDAALEPQLYEAATDVLIQLDRVDIPDLLPVFTPSFMAEQLAPYFEWYLKDGADAFDAIAAELESVLTRTWGPENRLSLRDFHAENLVWLPERGGAKRAGLLDYQDAMAGPPGYDLVSLLQDARRDVSPDVAAAMITRFATGTGRDAEQFHTGLAAISLQRNLRILGVFARLSRLHGKPRYLKFMPRVWNHVTTALAHPELRRLSTMMHGQLPPPESSLLNRLKTPCNSDRP